jgi:hypothetical protein
MTWGTTRMKYYKNKNTKKYSSHEEERFSKLSAKNDTRSTIELFRDRKAYKIEALSHEKKSINFWEQNFLYGKVNMSKDPVYLSEFNLLQFKDTDNETIFALNFVVDAFEDFKTHMKTKFATLRNKAFAPGIVAMYDLKVKKGWESLPKKYSEYLRDISTSFASSFLTPARERKIRDFSSFMDVYSESLKTLTKHFPLSLSGYVKSIHCPVNVSGLVIEIMFQDKDDDLQKRIFLQDDNYDLFVGQARKFGFLVDKNCPWRLVADIFSPVMKKYMSKRGIPFDSNSLFEIFYDKTSEIEIASLKHYLAEQYNNYVLSKPTITIPIQKKTQAGKTCKKVIIRKPLMCFDDQGYVDNQSDYSKQFGDLYWIKFYISLRALEKKLDHSTFVVDTALKKIYDYYKLYGLTRTVDKINRDFETKGDD